MNPSQKKSNDALRGASQPQHILTTKKSLRSPSRATTPKNLCPTSRKAQAAIEFLMTYGWALLAVLVAIGALAYFGVLDPSKILPERCNFQQELPCTGFQINTTHVKFELKNAAAQVVNITKLQYKEATANAFQDCKTLTPNPIGKILIEQKKLITCEFQTPYESGRRLKLKFNVEWNNDNPNFSHVGAGEIYGTVQ